MGLNTQASKCDELLWFLSGFRKGLTWRELLGRHPWVAAHGGGFGDLYGKTREEISKTPIEHGEAISGEYNFPRQTLHRCLKKFIKEGIVEKTFEPRKQGHRGRQTYRYRIKHPERMHFRVPANRPAGLDHPAFFFGNPIAVGTTREHVRMFPEEKKKFDELFNEERVNGCGIAVPNRFKEAVLKERWRKRQILRHRRTHAVGHSDI